MSGALAELASGDSRLRVVAGTGGAIARLSWRGVEVLRPAPEAAIREGRVRQMACFPLVPYSNRIGHARLDFGGRRYALRPNFPPEPHAIHGVGWQRPWTVAPRAHGPVPPEWDFRKPRAAGPSAVDHCFTGWSRQAVLDYGTHRVSLAASEPLDHPVCFAPGESLCLRLDDDRGGGRVSAGRLLGSARLVLEARAQLGQCPLRSVAEQALYWVDIAGRAIHRFHPATGRDYRWPMPCEPGVAGRPEPLYAGA